MRPDSYRSEIAAVGRIVSERVAALAAVVMEVLVVSHFDNFVVVAISPEFEEAAVHCSCFGIACLAGNVDFEVVREAREVAVDHRELHSEMKFVAETRSSDYPQASVVGVEVHPNLASQPAQDYSAFV